MLPGGRLPAAGQHTGSRGDGLPVVAAGDLDASRLGLLTDRDGQGEHAGTVVGGDLVGVQGLAEEDLAGEDARWPLGDDHLSAVGMDRGALGADGQHVLLDSQADGIGLDARQVEVDVEAVAAAIGVHQHRGRPGGGAENLLGEPVQLTERVGAHEHDQVPPCRVGCDVTLMRSI